MPTANTAALNPTLANVLKMSQEDYQESLDRDYEAKKIHDMPLTTVIDICHETSDLINETQVFFFNTESGELDTLNNSTLSINMLDVKVESIDTYDCEIYDAEINTIEITHPEHILVSNCDDFENITDLLSHTGESLSDCHSNFVSLTGFDVSLDEFVNVFGSLFVIKGEK